jgi:hypothetical protein
MNDELERKLKQLGLRAASTELDERIEQLLNHAGPVLTTTARQPATISWRMWCATAATFLTIGIGIGFLLASIGPPKANQSHFADGSTSTLNSNSVDAIPSPAVSPSASLSTGIANPTESISRTHILTKRWFETSDGKLAQGYLATTRKRVWKFDESTQSMKPQDVTIPRLIVSAPPGI